MRWYLAILSYLLVERCSEIARQASTQRSSPPSFASPRESSFLLSDPRRPRHAQLSLPAAVRPAAIVPALGLGFRERGNVVLSTVPACVRPLPIIMLWPCHLMPRKDDLVRRSLAFVTAVPVLSTPFSFRTHWCFIRSPSLASFPMEGYHGDVDPSHISRLSASCNELNRPWEGETLEKYVPVPLHLLSHQYQSLISVSFLFT